MHSLFMNLICNLASLTKNDIKPNKEDNILELTQDEFSVIAGAPQVDNEPEG